MVKPRIFKRAPTCRDGERSVAAVYRVIADMPYRTPLEHDDLIVPIENGPSGFPLPSVLVREALDVLAWDGHVDTWYEGGRVKWARASEHRAALPSPTWRYFRDSDGLDGIRTGERSLDGVLVDLRVMSPDPGLEVGPVVEVNQWPTVHRVGIRRADEAAAIAARLGVRLVIREGRSGYTWPALRAELAAPALVLALAKLARDGARDLGLILPDRGLRL